MPLIRPLPLSAGLACLALLWALVAPARESFTGHMTLHMGIMVGAAPLLALGLPGLVRALGRIGPSAALAPVAAVVEFVVVWGWHAPALCTAAQRVGGVFVLEQASWVAVGWLLWASVLRDWRGAGIGLWAGVLALLLTAMHMTFLGTLLTLAAVPSYGTALFDQQVGGVIMLAAGGIVYTAAGLALAARGLAPAEGAAP